jgi:adenylate kinase family enzyme
VSHRVVIFGNSGSGKTTMAGALATELGVPHLDLDSIAWERPLVRRSIPATVALLYEFIEAHPAWATEGCYGEVVAAAAVHCDELRFLNPGIEACIANCLRRPWEPTKFPSKAEQDAMLEALLDWVREYERRDDEYGLARHRAVFESFRGPKREYGREP